VLRLFHTELETVYEEFNRAQDNDGRAYKKMNELLYPNHPYGTQTTMGTGEHLKNPSMVKIHEFFETYYVPNNMAVILAGDIDYDKHHRLGGQTFRHMEARQGASVHLHAWNSDPHVHHAEVTGPEAEWVDIAWRFDGYASSDAIMLQLIDRVSS
jgi:zinc protease